MTVETTNRKQTFSGGQGSLTFSFRTLVSNPEYIKTLVKLISTGAETELTYGSDYTVSVNSDGVGGTVTVLHTYSTSYNYVVYRETTATQGDDYDDFNTFPANTLENSLDRAIMIAQEQQEETARTLRYPISAGDADTELPTPEANAFIGWNSAGDGLENKDLPDPNILQKASTATAEAASNDTDYMTALKVKQEVEKAGAVSIPAGNISGLPTTSTTTILAAAWPVGSIFISVSSTNPGTSLGIGTWTAFGTGKMLVGFDGGQTEFDTIEETGGAKTVTLTTNEMPAHTHTVATSNTTGGGTTNVRVGVAAQADTPQTTSSSGNGAAFSILNPYIVVYMFKRTA